MYAQGTHFHDGYMRPAGHDRSHCGRDLESMAKADKGKVMTFGYDLEVLDVTLEKVENAARDMVRNHKVTDWFAFRLGNIRREVDSLRNLIKVEKILSEP